MSSMSSVRVRINSVRVAVEWLFKEIATYFSFLDFKKDLKIGLSPVGKLNIVCVLMTNVRTCLYKSQTSDYLDVNPLMLEAILMETRNCVKKHTTICLPKTRTFFMNHEQYGT